MVEKIKPKISRMTRHKIIFLYSITVILTGLSFTGTKAQASILGGEVCAKALQVPIAAPKACRRASFCKKAPPARFAPDYFQSSHVFFNAFQSACPEYVWKQDLDEDLKTALEDFVAKRRLANGKIYGNSVRDYGLGGKNLQIQDELPKIGCNRDGKGLAHLTLFCDDGGIVNIYPAGTPEGKSHAEPEATKALVFPADGEASDEI